MGAYCAGKVHNLLPLRFQIMRTFYCVGMMHNVLYPSVNFEIDASLQSYLSETKSYNTDHNADINGDMIPMCRPCFAGDIKRGITKVRMLTCVSIKAKFNQYEQICPRCMLATGDLQHLSLRCPGLCEVR